MDNLTLAVSLIIDDIIENRLLKTQEKVDLQEKLLSSLLETMDTLQKSSSSKKDDSRVEFINISKGDRGPEGKQGPKGDRGNTGKPGPIGLRGIQGPQGPKGDKGDPGPQGKQGIQGSKGPKGDKGDVGPEGRIGPKGDRGPQGFKGEDGKSIVEVTLNEGGTLSLVRDDGVLFSVDFRKVLTEAKVDSKDIEARLETLATELSSHKQSMIRMVSSLTTGSGEVRFSRLDDVLLSNVKNGEAIVYDGTTKSFVNRVITGGVTNRSEFIIPSGVTYSVDYATNGISEVKNYYLINTSNEIVSVKEVMTSTDFSIESNIDLANHTLVLEYV